MGTLWQELLRADIYKRTQGRITRQVTFAALALIIVTGVWRLSGVLQRYDPWRPAQPAVITCTSPSGRVEAEGELRITGNKGTAIIPLKKGQTLLELARLIDAQRDATGVGADLRDAQGGKRNLVLVSTQSGAKSRIRLQIPEKALDTLEGLGTDATVYGRDALNLGLRFLIPGLLLAVGLWVSFRVVNMPNFADFLIAVEAEMNKVSWPTRVELLRASVVVLLLIFTLAFVLAGYDFLWSLFFRKLLHIM